VPAFDSLGAGAASGFFTAPRLAFGPGAIEQLSGLGARRTLVVADPNPVLATVRRRVAEELAKSEAVVEHVDAGPIDPSLASLQPAVERARGFGPDWIVAVGGGSTIHSAKGIWVAYQRPDLDLGRITPVTDLRLRERTRFVAVPTTSGSGEEAAWTASFRAEGGGTLEVSSRELIADWALLDPKAGRSLPPERTADGGAESLTHALEALASEWGNPFCAPFAREVVSSVALALPKAFRRPDDDLRAVLHYAATMAGIAVANAQSGLAQALARQLSVVFPHSQGRLMGVLMPFVVEFNFPAARERYQTLAPVLGPTAVANRHDLAERLRSVLSSAEIPRSLSELGLDGSDLDGAAPSIAGRVARTPAAIANPRLPSTVELTRLLKAAWEGAAVNF